ncbi:HalOD1 output domain-containing protein [Halorubrum coriense]|uniref:HalOD1 output domain-containing protein n=1 Tax=Halorubrum coriense TaxID=64713 RepID=UPI000677B4FE|nr:HalOD1 output domain-containing protein [Halorubrum coriense]
MSGARKEICVTVSETVSDALGEPVDALPPLSDAIDTDGLDAVMTGDSSHDVTVAFSYAGMTVFVYDDSTVYVCPERIHEDGPTDARV